MNPVGDGPADAVGFRSEYIKIRAVVEKAYLKVGYSDRTLTEQHKVGKSVYHAAAVRTHARGADYLVVDVFAQRVAVVRVVRTYPGLVVSARELYVGGASPAAGV